MTELKAAKGSGKLAEQIVAEPQEKEMLSVCQVFLLHKYIYHLATKLHKFTT